MKASHKIISINIEPLVWFFGDAVVPQVVHI